MKTFSSMRRTLILTGVYGVVLTAALAVSYLARFDFEPFPEAWEGFRHVVWWLVPVQILFLAANGQYATLLTYFSVPDGWRIATAMGSAAAVALLVRLVLTVPLAPPIGVVLIDLSLALVALASLRLAFRRYREKTGQEALRVAGRSRRVAIVGAGDVGADLVTQLLSRPGQGLEPVVLADDDRNKWKTKIHGVPVAGGPEEVLRRWDEWRLDEAILAMPSAALPRVREITRRAREAGRSLRTVPSVHQMVNGHVEVNRIRPVQIEDLLGREPVELLTPELRGWLQGRAVMVTGAGGSIGRELARLVRGAGLRRLILVDRSEPALFEVEQECLSHNGGTEVAAVVADIRSPALARRLREEVPEILLHAAAHKHVPLMEQHPEEAVANNTLGTARLADAAREAGVGLFVLVSTDKAVRPTSVMGASKRLAEMYLQARQSGSRTRLCAVRFGNVLGSSGSVIPTFRRQIAAGGPVTVTHAEAERYFMTIPEAAGLVLQAARLAQGGEVFFLESGEPVRIADLARQMVELSGLRPDRDIEIRITGLRPGEKLREEWMNDHENRTQTAHPKITRLQVQPESPDRLERELAALETLVTNGDQAGIRAKLRELVADSGL